MSETAASPITRRRFLAATAALGSGSLLAASGAQPRAARAQGSLKGTKLTIIAGDWYVPETNKMLGGEHDRANAIVSIHPGAGGTESQDWAEMLLRMYLKWAERRGLRREVIDYQPGDEAGAVEPHSDRHGGEG